ncbi:MAG TPA: HEAT repeat domain-containing protein, partial [Thermoanaerobaculia bacterium]|nr:HEAT repeat domain-containing protein [Thermoanaerobaculia bacterium]
KLAEAFYRHGVAILSIDRNIAPWELEMLFRFVAADPRMNRAPLWEELAAAGITHVTLTPADYSGVRATDDVDGAIVEKPATLLDDILRALLSGHEISAEGAIDVAGETISADGLSSILRKYLDADQGPGGAQESLGAMVGRKQSLVDMLVARIEQHLARPDPDTREVTIHQIANLLRALPEDLQSRVLESAVLILARDPGAEEELRSLARVLTPDEVFHALSSLRQKSVPLSNHALRLLQTLMTTMTADGFDVGADPAETRALTEQIATLLGDEDVDRFNPPDHKRLLEEIDLEMPPSEEGPRERALELGPQRLDTLQDEAIASRVRFATLELILRQPPQGDLEPAFRRLEDDFLELLGTMQMTDAIALVDEIQALVRDPAPPHVQVAARASMERIGTGDAVQVLVDWLHLASEDLIPQIRRVIDLFGAFGTKNFLFALAEEGDRSRRRRLFDFLAGLGPVIVPDATALLDDRRWYVVRNMIALLRTVGDRQSLPKLRALTDHEDIRVRLEAIKSLLSFESRLPTDLLRKAITDPDPKLAETAIMLCGNYGIDEAEDPLVDLVTTRDWFGRKRSARLKALRALAELGRPTTLDKLEPVLRDRFFSRASIEERRYAYEMLEHYPQEARARWLEYGRTSRDAAIRETAMRLSRRRPPQAPEAPPLEGVSDAARTD